MRGIDDLDVGGATVLLRTDLNVPLDATKITDDGRIRASLPTISKLASRGARIMIFAHLGRPTGADYAARAAGGPSLAPVAQRLAELLGQEVRLAADVAGESAAAVAAGLPDGGVGMAQNVRFEPAETSKDDAERAGLARRMAALAGSAGRYVGDGFGALHRKHASVYDLPALLPHAAGDLVLDEVAVLRRLTEDPQRPYVVVLGGAKPSDKLAVIANLLASADRLLIGGGMSYTFLKAQGHEVGKSLLEAAMLPRVTELLAEAARRGVEVVLPVDLVAATDYAPDAEHEAVPVTAFPADRESLDMGPATRKLFADKLADAKTVFWNGPVGVFEFPAFAAGTRAVAEAISHVTGLTVVGGGDSAAAVRTLGFPEGAFTHISTGGGASLEYLEGRTLPGLAALETGGDGPGGGRGAP
jgi:phosphoglycerate kinase